MNTDSLILLISLLSISLSLTCESYTCGSLPSDTCSLYNSITNTLVLQSCSSSEDYCNTSVDPGVCVSSTTTSTPTAAGGSCNSTSECFGGTCTSNHCTGISSGGSCTNSTECSATTYCFSSFCTLLRENNEACLISKDCVHGSGCLGGICVSYFSVANGQEIAAGHCDPLYLESFFCQSYACYIETNGTNICIAPVASSQPIPHGCSSNANCLTNEIPEIGSTFQMPCVCGNNPNGQAYCDSASGDPATLKFVEQYKNYFSSAVGDKCSRVIDDFTCAGVWWDPGNYARFVYLDFMYLNSVQIYEAESCVLNLVYPGYDAMISYYDTYGWACAVTASLMFLAF